jgi:TolA-binding protein
MEINVEQYNKIIQFLDADMTIAEMDAFEKELEANPSMRSQLDFEQSIRNNFLQEENKKDTIDVQHSKNSTTIKPIANKNNWFAIAASLIAIVSIATFYIFKSEKKAPIDLVKNIDTLNVIKGDTVSANIVKVIDTIVQPNLSAIFEEYFEPDKIPENYPIQLAAELTDYEKGNYASIQKLDITKVTETRGGDDKRAILELAHYYKGIALLKSNKLEDAITNLQWVKNNATDASMKANANWYLGLGYLKMREISKVKILFKKISSYGRYKNKVKEIIQLIE